MDVLTTEEKLKIREAQLNETSLSAQKLQTILQYDGALAKAHAATVAAIAEAEKRLGYELDPQTLAKKAGTEEK